MADVGVREAVAADETRVFAEAVWEQWTTGTLHWLQDLGHWSKLDDQREAAVPEAHGRCAFVMPGGALAIAERDGTLPVHRVRFEVCFEPEDTLETAVQTVTDVLDTAVDTLSMAVARLAGLPGGEDRQDLIAASGALSAVVEVDEHGRWARGELPVALAVPVPREAEAAVAADAAPLDPPPAVAEPELDATASTAPPPPPLAEEPPAPKKAAAAKPKKATGTATTRDEPGGKSDGGGTSGGEGGPSDGDD